MLEYPPPPCCVDDTPFTACVGDAGPYSVDAAGRIHPGRGGVIVIVQLPARDAMAATAPRVPLAAAAPPDPSAPAAAPPPARPRRSR